MNASIDFFLWDADTFLPRAPQPSEIHPHPPAHVSFPELARGSGLRGYHSHLPLSSVYCPVDPRSQQACVVPEPCWSVPGDQPQTLP